MPIPHLGPYAAGLCVFESKEAAEAHLVHAGNPTGLSPTPLRPENVINSVLDYEGEPNLNHVYLNPIQTLVLNVQMQGTLLSRDDFASVIENSHDS